PPSAAAGNSGRPGMHNRRPCPQARIRFPLPQNSRRQAGLPPALREPMSLVTISLATVPLVPAPQVPLPRAHPLRADLPARPNRRTPSVPPRSAPGTVPRCALSRSWKKKKASWPEAARPLDANSACSSSRSRPSPPPLLSLPPPVPLFRAPMGLETILPRRSPRRPGTPRLPPRRPHRRPLPPLPLG
ncbi:MAG: hypothetical protein JWQ75_3336, partial [Pseudarthrobacter sp.]|nr:hypothetical protein [Pseudarthrobacter sp.]